MSAPRCLVIDRGLPTPRRDAGSARAVSMLRALAGLGLEVSFLPADLDASPARLAALAGEPFGVLTAPELGSLRRDLRRRAAEFRVIVLSRVGVADRLLRPLRRWAPEAAILFDTVDLHFLRERRRAEVEGNRRLLAATARLERKELGLAARADLTLLTSSDEAALLAREAPELATCVVPPACRVRAAAVPFAARRGLLFVGGFAHLPNVDGVRWFVREVLPLVAARIREVTLEVVGPDPPTEILDLASERVRVRGFVDDLEACQDAARLAEAPLRYGAGVKLKVLESLAAGLPCAVTPVAAEGLGLEHGGEALIAESAGQLAGAVERLHEDESLWMRIAERGRQHAADRFSPERLQSALRSALERVGVELA